MGFFKSLFKHSGGEEKSKVTAVSSSAPVNSDPHPSNQSKYTAPQPGGRGSSTERSSPSPSAAANVFTSSNNQAPFPPSAPSTQDSGQKKLADYEIFRTLGVGSFGRVQLVRHRATSTYYAMKRMRKAEVIRQKQVEHTNNEQILLSRTSQEQVHGTDPRYTPHGHPFLVKVVDCFQDDHFLYIVMEYIAGGELFTLLRKVKSLPPYVATFYAAEVVLAFEFLHSHNIVYRDLKPENMVIHQDGHIRIIDFGFAKEIEGHTYTLCGTPDYLAPEILKQQGYGRAVDWWALGVLIYEMLTGCPPFYDSQNMRLYDKILVSKPHFPPSMDSDAKDLIEKLLEKDPYKRLGSGHAGVEEIKQHPWFKDVRWDTLLACHVTPPYRPKVAAPGDDTNFDKYPEDDPIDPLKEQPVDSAFFPGFISS